MADIVLDFHSGGKTLDFLPLLRRPHPARQGAGGRGFDLVEAFGAPYSMKMLEIDAVGMYDTAAEEMGKVFVTTELGGGGTASARTAHRVARAAGTCSSQRVSCGARSRQPTQWLDMPDGDCFHLRRGCGTDPILRRPWRPGREGSGHRDDLSDGTHRA
jgi:N-alpha-acetyl-L-2,4-diaminobutyrate deacetylase